MTQPLFPGHQTATGPRAALLRGTARSAVLVMLLALPGCSWLGAGEAGEQALDASQLAAGDRADQGGEASPALMRAAEAAWNSPDRAASRHFYEQLFRKNPQDPLVRFRFAESLRLSGEPGVAIDVMRPLTSLESPDPVVLISFAKANLQNGDSDAALAAALAAVRLAPDAPEAHHVFGVVLSARGDYAGAVTSFETALAQGAPDAAKVLNNLGLAHAQMGDGGAALNSLDKALRLDPTNRAIADNLAMVQEAAATGALVPQAPAVPGRQYDAPEMAAADTGVEPISLTAPVPTAADLPADRASATDRAADRATAADQAADRASAADLPADRASARAAMADPTAPEMLADLPPQPAAAAASATAAAAAARATETGAVLAREQVATIPADADVTAAARSSAPPVPEPLTAAADDSLLGRGLSQAEQAAEMKAAMAAGMAETGHRVETARASGPAPNSAPKRQEPTETLGVVQEGSQLAMAEGGLEKPVKLRIGAHKAHDRMVFDHGAELAAEIGEGQLTITVPPGSRVDAQRLARELERSIAAASVERVADRLKLTVVLTPGTVVKELRLRGEDKLVLDLSSGRAMATKAKPQAPSQAPAAASDDSAAATPAAPAAPAAPSAPAAPKIQDPASPQVPAATAAALPSLPEMSPPAAAPARVVPEDIDLALPQPTGRTTTALPGMMLDDASPAPAGIDGPAIGVSGPLDDAAANAIPDWASKTWLAPAGDEAGSGDVLTDADFTAQ